MPPIFALERHGPRAVTFGNAPGNTTSALTATSRVALRERGPYSLVADALERREAVRRAFALGLGLACVSRWRHIRAGAFLMALAPLGALVELDREQLRLGFAGAASRLALDAALALLALMDLATRVPRYPRVAGVILLAAAARFLMYVTAACGHAHALIYAASFAAAFAAAAVLFVAPTRARIVGEALDRLGISREDVRATRIAPRPSLAFVGSAVAAAAALPLLLTAARSSGVAPWAQVALFAGYGAIVPTALEWIFERRLRLPRVEILRVLFVTVVAFALTRGLIDGARYAIDGAASASRCLAPSALQSGAQRVVDDESREVNKMKQAIDRSGAGWGFFAMSVVVVPLVEERVYRSHLQRVLVARWGAGRGIAAAAVLFGVAHLGVYRVAAYQTALLGASFGFAYFEGGFVAAALVHALWNLHLLV